MSKRKYTEAEVRETLRKHIETSGVRGTAESLGVSPANVSMASSGKPITGVLADALGFKAHRVSTYTYTKV